MGLLTRLGNFLLGAFVLLFYVAVNLIFLLLVTAPVVLWVHTLSWKVQILMVTAFFGSIIIIFRPEYRTYRDRKKLQRTPRN